MIEESKSYLVCVGLSLAFMNFMTNGIIFACDMDVPKNGLKMVIYERHMAIPTRMARGNLCSDKQTTSWCWGDPYLRAAALSHITPPKVTSLHGHASSRKSHQVAKSHITSTQTPWPRTLTNMRQDEKNIKQLVNVWVSIAQMSLAYNQVACFSH